MGRGVTTYASTPTYNATGFNSRPAFSFNSNGLQCTLPMGTGTELTTFLVGNFTSSSGFNGRALSYVASGQIHDYDNNQSWYLARDNGTSALHLGRNAGTASAAVGYNTNARIIATIDSSGVMKIYVNGVATTGSTLNAAFGASGVYVIGALNPGPPNDNWNGFIAETGVCNRFNDATTCAALDSYLQTKWGL